MTAAISVPGALAAQQAAPPEKPPTAFLPAPQQYGLCLDQARKDPKAAYEQATLWRSLGGGFPADHCAAVALIGLKRYAEAASQLETMAGAMMRADAELRGDALAQAGQAWLLAGKPDSAKADFDGALQYKPGDIEILVDRAEAYALSGRFFDAIDDLSRVLAVAPKRTDALIYRASAYRQTNSLDLALADVDAALAIEPNSVTGLLERGNIRGMRGELAGAQADWKRVATLAPNSQEAHAAEDNLAHLAEEAQDKPAPKAR